MRWILVWILDIVIISIPMTLILCLANCPRTTFRDIAILACCAAIRLISDLRSARNATCGS